MSITEREFLMDPEAAIAGGEEVPADWVRKAWEQHETFREDVAYYLAKSVSTSGNFDGASVWLKTLPAAISAEDAVTLYEEILEQSHRLELEWRPAFVKAFPDAASLLPQPLDAAILVATLEQQIRMGYEEDFDATVDQVLSLPGGMPALQRPNEDGETLMQLAERLKHDNLAAILRKKLSR